MKKGFGCGNLNYDQALNPIFNQVSGNLVLLSAREHKWYPEGEYKESIGNDTKLFKLWVKGQA